MFHLRTDGQKLEVEMDNFVRTVQRKTCIKQALVVDKTKCRARKYEQHCRSYH